MATDDNSDAAAEGDVDPGVARALEARFGRTGKAAGQEPADLGEVALYVDGALPEERRRAVEARLGAEPELREVVDELRRLEGTGAPAAEPTPSNVIPLVVPSVMARRVGAADAVPGGTLRPLATPERKKNPLRLAVTGIGAALALAALMFLMTRPTTKTEGTSGAGLAGKGDAVAIGFEPGHAVIEVEAAAAGEVSVMLATPRGTTAVGVCDTKTCLVTSDTLPVRAGKTTVRAAIGGDAGTCAFVLVLTAEGGPTGARSAAPSGHVDPHAVAEKLGTVVSEGCVLESMDELRGVSGARHVAFMKVP